MTGPEEAVATIYLYDPDRRDLADRERLVRGQLDGTALGELAVRAISSRNVLLLALQDDSVAGRGSVAFIDLREDDLDISYHGYRIVDTIRRHPSLSAASRPLVWTSYATRAVLDQCNAMGAYGVVSDSWILNTPGAPLGDIVEWAFAQRPVHRRLGNPFRTYHRAGADPEAEEKTRDARFRQWFDLPGNAEYYALLWGFAHEVDKTYLMDYLTERLVVTSPKAAEKRIEQLRAAMQARFGGRNDAITARRFLAQIMPAAPNVEFAELDLPRVSEAQAIWRDDPNLRRLAFLAPSDADIIGPFFDDYLPPAGRVATSLTAGSVTAAIDRIAARRGEPRTAVRDSIYRGVRALDDARRSARIDGARSIL